MYWIKVGNVLINLENLTDISIGDDIIHFYSGGDTSSREISKKHNGVDVYDKVKSYL